MPAPVSSIVTVIVPESVAYEVIRPSRPEPPRASKALTMRLRKAFRSSRASSRSASGHAGSHSRTTLIAVASRRAAELGRAPEGGDLGDHVGEMVHAGRDLPGELLALRVPRAAEPLPEVAGIEAQARERILDLVGDLRRHPPERRERTTPQALQLVGVADRDRRLRREERQQLEIVLGGLDARRRLDDERSRRPALNDERRRDDRARLAVAARRADDRYPLVHRVGRGGLERLPRRRR